MPLIQCKKGYTQQYVMGTPYTFERDPHGRFVAQVHNSDHVDIFLSVEHYQLALPLILVPPPPAATEPLPIPAAALEQPAGLGSQASADPDTVLAAEGVEPGQEITAETPTDPEKPAEAATDSTGTVAQPPALPSASEPAPQNPPASPAPSTAAPASAVTAAPKTTKRATKAPAAAKSARTPKTAPAAG